MKRTPSIFSSTAVAMFLVLGTSVLAERVGADDGQPAYTDAEKAPVDFQLQGEYKGAAKIEDGELQLGMQVYAMGDGKFGLVVFTGGLPGEGGTPAPEEGKAGRPGNPIVGELKEGQVIFTDDGGRGVLKDGKLELFHGEAEEPLAVLTKVERKSPTLGAKPPEGATVLFDGSSADAFENGKVVDGLLAATNCYSKKKLGDHQLHVEFRTPFMPKSTGQARGNSGVYVQGRYEVQVLDSFALKGVSNECGGIYRVSEPATNMCFPPLSWQTYDIDFTAARYDQDGKKTENARITVKHNGVVIHDNIELPEQTPGFHAEAPEPDGLFLQDHGNPVFFRNIWVVEK